MKTNDLILLDKILEDEKPAYGVDLDEGLYFDLFGIDQILKNWDLSRDEIEDGITDGKDDGGIDAIYLFANGVLLNDSHDIPTMKALTNLEVIIITSKHADTFEQAVVNSEYSTINEFFDLSKDNSSLICPYNDRIIDKRLIFTQFYINNISKMNGVSIKYYYISRGNESLVGENIVSKSNQVVQKTRELISGCVCSFSFIGASSLLKIHNNKKVFHARLPFVSSLSADEKKYVVLCSISDYYSFITEDGNLKTYLFDSNVRDFGGFNKTNVDILESLEKTDGPDFWLLNNGITIISSNAINVGSSIDIENVQIVNGLQTSYTIFEFLKNHPDYVDDRKILVKIITETNEETRDMIIRATNNQTAIQEQSLHATDKIQLGIEKMLLGAGIYYDRKKNYYLNRGIEPSKIVSPLYLASGYFSLIVKSIPVAINLKQNFMSNDVAYKKIFVETNIECWPRIAKVLMKADEAFASLDLSGFGVTNGDNKRKTIRHICSFITLSRHFGTFNFNAKQIAELSLEDIDGFDFAETIKFLFEVDPVFDKKKWKRKEEIDLFVSKAKDKFAISDLPSFLNRRMCFYEKNELTAIAKRTYEKIKPFIPSQPWPKDVHKELAKKMHLKNGIVFGALSYGISIGDYYQQSKGKLFDKDGKELKVSK